MARRLQVRHGFHQGSALDAHCAEQGRACLRFDYSGHGLSGGEFEEGTISRWLEESLAAIRTQSEGPQIIVGSSMGGYIALLLARELANAGEAGQIAGMVLIAPAVDFPVALLWERAGEEARREIMEKGAWRRPSEYSNEPYVFTRALVEDARRHLLLGGVIRSYAPTRILQGMKDDDVPYGHALKLIEHMAVRPGDADAGARRRSPAFASERHRAAAPVRRIRGREMTSRPAFVRRLGR